MVSGKVSLSLVISCAPKSDSLSWCGGKGAGLRNHFSVACYHRSWEEGSSRDNLEGSLLIDSSRSVKVGAPTSSGLPHPDTNLSETVRNLNLDSDIQICRGIYINTLYFVIHFRIVVKKLLSNIVLRCTWN